MKLTWKVSVLFALISFGIGFIMGWHPTFESVRNFVIGGLSLGLVIEVVGLLRELFKEHREERAKKIESQNEKRTIFGRLLSEIERNQRLLQPLADSVTRALDSNDELSEEDKLPNDLNFDRTIYSNSSDKLGLLDDGNREKLDQYYSDLKYIGGQYERFQLIHNMSYSYLVVLELKDKSGKWNYSSPFWDETEKFLRHAKKIYDLGEELIIGLKEQIGIKPMMEGAESPAKEYLRLKAPDIRKLWSECENLKIQIPKDRKEIRDYIKNKSREGVSVYSKLDSIFDDSYITQNKFGEIVNRTEGDEICGLVDDYATTGKLTKDKEYIEYVEAIIKDKHLYEMLERARENRTLLNKKTVEYNKLLEKMEKIGR